MSTFVVEKTYPSHSDSSSLRLEITVDPQRRSVWVYSQVFNENGVPLISSDIWRGKNVSHVENLTPELLERSLNNNRQTSFWNFFHPSYSKNCTSARRERFFTMIASK